MLAIGPLERSPGSLFKSLCQVMKEKRIIFFKDYLSLDSFVRPFGCGKEGAGRKVTEYFPSHET